MPVYPGAFSSFQKNSDLEPVLSHILGLVGAGLVNKQRVYVVVRDGMHGLRSDPFRP